MVGFPNGNTWLLVGPAGSCLSHTLVLVELEEACAAMLSVAELKVAVKGFQDSLFSFAGA